MCVEMEETLLILVNTEMFIDLGENMGDNLKESPI